MRRRRYATVAIVFITQREWCVTYLASYEVNIYLWYYQIHIITFLRSFNVSPPESHPLPKIVNNKKN